jgi:cyanophycinase-like exopeptidase
MIMGGYVPAFSMRLGVPLINRWQDAFALVPEAVVVPHYNEFPEVMVNLMFGRRPKGSFLIGVDRDTALVISKDNWSVLGTGRVTVRRDRQVARYTQGQAVAAA